MVGSILFANISQLDGVQCEREEILVDERECDSTLTYNNNWNTGDTINFQQHLFFMKARVFTTFGRWTPS